MQNSAPTWPPNRQTKPTDLDCDSTGKKWQLLSRDRNCVNVWHLTEMNENATKIGCGDFSICQNGGGRHVGFLKLNISNCGSHRKCPIASPGQSSWGSVKPLPRYIDVGFSAAADILYWWNLSFSPSERWRKSNSVTVPILDEITQNISYIRHSSISQGGSQRNLLF